MKEETVYPLPLYNQTQYSKEELIEDLTGKVDPVGMTMILGAYEMAESVHEYQMRKDATPYFRHITRVARILVRELEYFNPEAISAAYLHDVLEDSDIITADVIKYNFGAHVGYLVEVLTKNIKLMGILREKEDEEYIQRLDFSAIDCKIVKFAERLDNYRCLEFGVKRNPFQYIDETEKYYFPMAGRANHRLLNIMVEEMKRMKSKLFA